MSLGTSAPQTKVTLFWSGDQAAFSPEALAKAALSFRQSAAILQSPKGAVGVGIGGTIGSAPSQSRPSLPIIASLPPLYPEWLGDRGFCEVHGLRFPYVAGAMANGIATSDIVIEMARGGMLGFFGSAGLSPKEVHAGLDRIQSALSGQSYGANLIHSPNEPDLEAHVAQLFLERGVTRVSASAYMALTEPLVHYAFSGVREEDGRITRKNYVFAKISRPEVAQKMMSPPPKAMLDSLVQKGLLTSDEARLAARLPVAEDITVESDSGGHTDNQALGAVFPVVAQLRAELSARFGYAALGRQIRVGAAGGLGTPASIAAAFGYGADYVVTGSVNQSAVESGLSDEGKKLLAQATMADVMMAPAADMFEMGVKVQVLKRGTMFASRAHRLYAAYRDYASLESMPQDVRQKLETQVLGKSADEIWEGTRAFFLERDPREVERAEADPKHKMALVFRWYLGLSSKWAIWGEAGRRLDYQIWCGPAMGAFNEWAKGSFMEAPENRTVAQIAKNLLEGAAVITRAGQLRSYGAPMPASAFQFSPRPIA